MRLWHQDLIKKLPRNQLLGQHRECCALRGLGWGKKHRTVNYVFDYSPFNLFYYHLLIMNEMEKRGYKVDPVWYNKNYRGLRAPEWNNIKIKETELRNNKIYQEHDKSYLEECIENLREKGIVLE